MSADDLDPPKLARHGMPLLEIENLHAMYNTRAEVHILAQALHKPQEFFT